MLTAEEPCHPIDQSRAVKLIKSVARDSFTCFVVDDVRVFLPLARFIYAGIVRARVKKLFAPAVKVYCKEKVVEVSSG